MRYRAFRTKKNDTYHFQFLTEDGIAVLNSQSYAEKNACFNGIKSVINNAGDEANYQLIEDGGKHYFIIKAGNNQEIGRSVAYDSVEAANRGIQLMIAEGPTATNNNNTSKGKTPPAPSTTTEKKSTSSSTDDYKPLAYYESKISGIQNGFETFAADGEHYFTYSVGGKVILISEGYSSDKSRDNGVNSVKKNMPIEARYKTGVHANGKHFFRLVAGNHQEIATSRWFDNEGEMNGYIQAIQGGEDAIQRFVSGGATPSGASENTSKKVYKDYKPLSFYEKNISGTEAGFDPFVEDGKYYFTVNHNGKPLLISEDYTSDSGRDNGMESIKKNMKIKDHFIKKQHANGKHYFILIAGNNQEIATSRWFDNEKELDDAIDRLHRSDYSTKAAKTKGEKNDDAAERTYLRQHVSYPCSDIVFDTFQSGGNDKYYFVFRTKEEKAILINGDVRGHKTVEELNNTIDQILKYGPDANRYFRKETKNGKHYFYIQNEEEKNIARSSLFYNEKSDMEAAIKLLACGAGLTSRSATTEKVAAATAGARKGQDEYLACSEYTGAAGFHKFTHENGEHYFGYNDDNGKTYLRSEGYSSEKARDNGIESVIKNAPEDKRWKTMEEDGKYFYCLKAGNHQEIARSCPYDSEAAMMAAMNWVRGDRSSIGKGATLVGGTWLSAFALANQGGGDGDTLKSRSVEESSEALGLTSETPTGGKIIKKTVIETKKVELTPEEEAKVKADAEAKARAEAEKLKAEAEAKAKAEADRLKAEAEAKAKEAEAKRKAEEDARRKAEEEARRKAEEEAIAKARAAAEAKRKAAEEARLKAEAEARAKAAEEAARREKERLAALAAAAAAVPVVSKVVSTTKTNVEKEKEDDYLPCKAYEGHVVNDKENNVALFKHENGQFYFAVYNEDGSVRLRSEGFGDAKERDQELSGVLKHLNDRQMYSTIRRGQYYINILEDKDGREVGRSCLMKDQASPVPKVVAAAAAAPVVTKVVQEIKKETPPPPPPKPKEKEDDYLPCEAYANHKMTDKKNRIARFTHKNGQHYFAVYDNDGKVRLRSEGFQNKKKLESELKDVIKYLNVKNRYETISRGKYYINVLKNEAGREIGRSCLLKEKISPIIAPAAAAAAAAVVAPKVVKATPPPPKPKPKPVVVEKKKEKVAAAAPVAAAASTGGGCMKFLPWLIGLLALAALAFFLMKGCDGCNKKAPVAPPPVTTPKEPTPTPPPAPVKTAVCDAAKDLKLSGGLGADIASYLADPESNYPKRFNVGGIGYGKNSNRLNSRAKKALDDLATCMKSCGDVDVNVYGYISENEQGSYRGNKEITLDDVRARGVVDYLKSRGVDVNRLNFEGDGTNDKGGIVIEIDKR